MKIIITGSLGHISKPLTKELIEKGHLVTVISSNQNRQADIELLGATAAIGSLEDVEFLTNTFAEADAVYCMVPPTYYYDHSIDPLTFYQVVGNNYATAIKASGVKRVVQLSSFGGDLDKGTGIILGSHLVEEILKKLPDMSLTRIRPTSFYYNLLGFIKMIKSVGFIASNYGGDDKVLMVSPKDIANAVADELVKTTSEEVRYVASDEVTCNEAASILGQAIGKPDLKWILISDEEMQKGLESNGFPIKLAEQIVELYGSLHSGLLAKDFYASNSKITGKVKLKDFAIDFAAAYNQ